MSVVSDMGDLRLNCVEFFQCLQRGIFNCFIDYIYHILCQVHHHIHHCIHSFAPISIASFNALYISPVWYDTHISNPNLVVILVIPSFSLVTSRQVHLSCIYDQTRTQPNYLPQTYFVSHSHMQNCYCIQIDGIYWSQVRYIFVQCSYTPDCCRWGSAPNFHILLSTMRKLCFLPHHTLVPFLFTKGTGWQQHLICCRRMRSMNISGISSSLKSF